ncbi:MAG: anthranilate phosphoribosyltransferase, partial [Gammaproteobacteria bacterium]|nr:anthranilate phosphoribosyltransferase [Gammaproteobacteria bacterium]
PLAHVLNQLGSRHVLIVHSEDGMDEISIGAPTLVAELKDGEVKTYTIQPEDYGMSRHPITDLAVDSAEASLKMVKSVLNGEKGPATDIVILNAGAAIYAAGLADDLQRGVEKAEAVIASGEAAAKLDALVKLSNSF